MRKKYGSRLMAEIHETARGLHRAGLINKRTMKEFDVDCLLPVRQLSASEIAKIRRREKVSQAVFARHLNVTTGLVSQWERGVKHPSGPALKLLAIVARKGLDAVA